MKNIRNMHTTLAIEQTRVIMKTGLKNQLLH